MSLNHLFILAVGLLIGFLAGALPGLSSSTTVALLFSLTIGMKTETALIFMAAIYCGAQYGGAVPAILFNTPGEAGSAATALDGYQMTLRGESGRALAIARVASGLGGIIASIVVIFIMGPLAAFSLEFKSPEMFVVAVFGLTLIAVVAGESIWKGLLSGALGLLLASISADPLLGQPRMTFGFLELYESVPFVPILIGLFAFSEMLYLVKRRQVVEHEDQLASAMFAHAAKGVADVLSRPFATLRAALIGVVIGIVPGTGTAIANFVSYAVAKMLSKEPEKFGKGIPDGVIASEACDNGVTAGAMVPTFALGIPGSATGAIMLAALILHGIQPGPRVLAQNTTEVYSVLVSMLVASALIIPIGLMITPSLALLSRVPVHYLVPTVTLLCFIGAFGIRYSLFDMWLVLVFGVIGYLMKAYRFPVVPLVIGLVLGPIAEGNFIRSLQLSQGDYGIFFSTPLTWILWVVVGLSLSLQPLQFLRSRRRQSTDNRSA